MVEGSLDNLGETLVGRKESGTEHGKHQQQVATICDVKPPHGNSLCYEALHSACVPALKCVEVVSRHLGHSAHELLVGAACWRDVN
eukprot:5687286-Prymnesium_polylepis.2